MLLMAFVHICVSRVLRYKLLSLARTKTVHFSHHKMPMKIFQSQTVQCAAMHIYFGILKPHDPHRKC